MPLELIWSICTCHNVPLEVFLQTYFISYQIFKLQVWLSMSKRNFQGTLCLDLTNNFLCNLPISLAHHGSLEEIHLTGNLFTSYPVILDTLPKLKHSDLLDLLFDKAKDNQEEEDENVTVSY